MEPSSDNEDGFSSDPDKKPDKFMESLPAISSQTPKLDRMEVIRATSYHRRDWDQATAVPSSNTYDHYEVRQLLLQTSPSLDSKLGTLQCLPYELISDICSLLDVRSLMNFRHVSRGARQITRDSRGYEPVVAHASHALAVALGTNVASWFTMSEFLEVLHDRYCDCCNRFGGFLFLPSYPKLKRFCFSCIRKDCTPTILHYSVTKKRLKHSPGCLIRSSQGFMGRSMPAIKALAGCYSMQHNIRNKGFYVIPELFLNIECLREEDYNALMEPSSNTDIMPFMMTTAFPHLDVRTGIVQNGISCCGCQVAVEKAWRMGTASYSLLLRRDKVFTHSQFMRHFQSCDEAQQIWKLSQEGIEISSLSRWVNRGGS